MKKFGLLGGSALCSAAVLGLSVATPAYAQDTTTGADPCDNPADAAAAEACAALEGTEAASTDGEAIVVVGSRLRRNQFNTADNIQIIGRDQFTQAGFNSAAEILQSTTVTGGSAQINNSFGGFVTAGGPGANTISLRGLGATRTLLLLNGRRVAPAGSRGSVGSADLNVLPSAMIDRIEILNTGASSIYGSDAVAGVINIVTRTNIEGLIFEGQHNISEEGGGNSERYSLVFGHQGDRFRIAGSLEYYNRDPLTLGERDWARCQTSYRLSGAGAAPGSGDFIEPETGQPTCYPTGVTGEGGVSVNVIGTPNIAGGAVDQAPGVPAGYTGVCNRFRPDPTAGGFIPGYECVGGGTLNINIRDTFPRSLLSSHMISPAEVYTGFLQASYELDMLGGAEIYTEILVNRRNSEQESNRQFTLDYLFGSPLIPVELRFPVAFGAAGTSVANPGSAIGIRVFADYGIYNNRQTVDYAKVVGGLRGDLFGGWRYDVYASKTWSDSTYTTDLILSDRLGQSLDVVASGSGFVCRDTSGGCVAAPALTPGVVGGQFPAAWFNYVTAPVTGNTVYRERVLNATFDGPLFRLPYGEVQAAIGVEQRAARIDDTPDEESQNSNLYGFTSSTITRGSDSVWEVFGEVEIPLVRDVPFVHDLTINGSARYTEYESYGGQETWKLGGLYAPFRWLSFRGSYGTSYRAPALFEQFLGSTSGFQPASNDPCNNLGAPGQNPVRVANCQADGIPLGFNQTSGITVLQRGGAESGLGAETSRAWTVGGVLQPDFGSGFGSLSFSADYFNVLVENGVSQLGFGTILQQCYDDPDFRAESICALVVRNPTTNQLQVTTGFVNVSNAQVSGWDFNLRYSRDIGPGRFRLTAAVTKFNERYNQNLPTDPIAINIGTINNPEWTGTFDASYAVDGWTLRYGVEWVDAMNSPLDYLFAAGTPQSVRDTYDFEVPDYFLHSASIRYSADRFGITLGVRNLTDREPPQISSGAYNRIGNAPLYSGYDYLGRTFFVNVTTAFR